MPTKPTTALSLYDITVAAVCEYYKHFKQDLRTIPDTILFDVYVMLYQQGRLCVLCMEFSDLELFSKMLKMTKNRIMLIKCFQALMSESRVAKDLVRSYKIKCDYFKQNNNFCTDLRDSTIDLGIKLGGFLNDAGWFLESSAVLEATKELCRSLPDIPSSWRKTLDCCHRLLHAQVVYSMFEKATETKNLAEEIVYKLKEKNEKICLAGIYTQFSVYSFYMSNYNQAYMWSIKAVKELDHQSNSRLVVEALSQASKSCVVKREFKKAESLVRMAVYLASEAFGTNHPKYAETLLDYGFYLLNSDSMKDSVTVYEKALKLEEEVFGSLNLHVAVTHEDLAYALYVHEYSSGQFNTARHHVEEAIATMTKLLPEEHLMLASAQRVKALILEEIALDHMSSLTGAQKSLLAEAEKLHKNALSLSFASFGEDNVQTAKHYGNLGRLYQSMKKYKEAETMHLKAIKIKEKLLGQDDYEVGLSVGHLASLYNYHMKEYRKAENLYIRSINISFKLFTDSYSGLEYDYRGLMHVYEQLGELDNVANYLEVITRWKVLREEQNMQETAPLALDEAPSTLSTMKKLFEEPV